MQFVKDTRISITSPFKMIHQALDPSHRAKVGPSPAAGGRGAPGSLPAFSGEQDLLGLAPSVAQQPPAGGNANPFDAFAAQSSNGGQDVTKMMGNMTVSGQGPMGGPAPPVQGQQYAQPPQNPTSYPPTSQAPPQQYGVPPQQQPPNQQYGAPPPPPQQQFQQQHQPGYNTNMQAPPPQQQQYQQQYQYPPQQQQQYAPQAAQQVQQRGPPPSAASQFDPFK
jgi:hypothetical protein